MADVYFIEEQPEKAREEYESIASAKDALVKEKALFQLAYLEILEGNIDMAGKRLTEMLKKFPDGKYVNDALRWSIFIEKNQGDSQFSKYLEGLKHRKQMKYDMAVSDFEDIIENDSASPLAEASYLRIAEIYAKELRFDMAISKYRQFIEAYPQSKHNAEAQAKIGDIFAEKLKNYEKAKVAYEKVILDYPQCIQADLVRKKLQKLSGKLQN